MRTCSRRTCVLGIALFTWGCGGERNGDSNLLGTTQAGLQVPVRADYVYYGPQMIPTVAFPVFAEPTGPVRWNIWPSAAAGQAWSEVVAVDYCEVTDSFVPGDYNNDHVMDLGCYRSRTNTWYVKFNTGTPAAPAFGAEASQVFGSPFGRFAPGDYDGDGKADCAYFLPNDGTWHVRTSSGSAGTICTGTESIVQFGEWTDEIVPGDYDGDGKTDRAVFRPSDGYWYVRRSGGGNDIVMPWGFEGDRPVPGDYNGDAFADYAYFHPTDGRWIIHYNPLGTPTPDPPDNQFGEETDRLVPGDYDGDLKTDLALFRPSERTWYVRRSQGGDMVRPDPSVLLGGFGSTATYYPKGPNSQMPFAVMEPRIPGSPTDAQRTGQLCHPHLWPGGDIPYEIVANSGELDGSGNPLVFSGVTQLRIVALANQWNAVTEGVLNLHPISGTPPAARLVFQPSKKYHACSLGYTEPSGSPLAGRSVCNLAPNELDHPGPDYSQSTHEIGHGIGLSHEHIRSDRDRFVVVDDRAFVPGNYSDNMWKCGPDDAGTDFGPYSFSNEMGYHTNPPYFIWYQDGTDHGREPGVQVKPDPAFPPRLQEEGADVLEEYAYAFGWRKFKSIGIDFGADRPRSKEIYAGVVGIGSPAIAAQGGRGVLDIFIRGNDNRLYRWYSTDGVNWAQQAPFGTRTWDADPAASSEAPGMIVVAEANQKNVSVIEFANGAWQSWVDLSGPTGPGSACSAPALASAGAQGSFGARTSLFVRACNGSVYRSQRGGVSSWGGWTLYTAPPSGVTFTGKPAAIATSGADELFIGDTTGHLRDRFLDGQGIPTWRDRGCCIGAGASPAAARSRTGRIDVIVRGQNGPLLWFFQDLGTSGFNPWTGPKQIGGMLQPTGDPAIASGYSDHVEAAALLNDGTLWTRSFDRPKRFLSQDYRWDRRTDLVFFRPSDNKWYVATANVDPGTGETGVTKHVPGTYDNFGVSTDRFVPADYDGDGQTDYALFRPSTGKWYVRLANGSGDTVYPTTGTFGDSTDTMVPGDYNGDGRADYAYFHPADRVWHVALSSSGATSTMQFGNTGDIPVPGDYTGDGTTDYAVFRPSAGKWFVRPREGLGFDIVYPPTGTFGGSTDRLVPADYDGDGRTDYAYYRISDKKWVSASSRTGAVVTLPQFGETSDRFVPADYDFDGKADQALYRPSTGTWYVRRSNGGNDIAAALGGTAADIVPYAR